MNALKLSLLLVTFFCLHSDLAGIYQGQFPPEICDNAIDDDADGLTDLQDPDCECPVIEPISRIPNPSFEEMNCCPSNRSELHCADTWIQASAPTTDYLHTCGWMGWEQFPPPLPFPDGNAVVGFRDGRFFQDVSEPTWKEYAGACLLAPLEEGIPYRFEFHIGFTGDGSSPPLNVTFFGNTDCNNLPFGQGNAELGCPTKDTTNWIRLGAVSVSGSNNWVQKGINVTPDRDIYAIAIGPDCSEIMRPFSTYYFFDNLVLDEKEAFEFRIQELTHPCSESFQLGVPNVEGATYQWYKDGIALLGETNPKLTVQSGEGDYQVRILAEENCMITRVYAYRIPTFQTILNKVTCNGDAYEFGDRILTDQGTYSQLLKDRNNCDSLVELNLKVAEHRRSEIEAKIFRGDNYEMDAFSFGEAGIHEIPLLTSEGCDSIVELTLNYFKVAIPDIFSPDGDGINDYFNIYGEADLERVKSLKIYSRWGELVYYGEELSPNSPSEGWDGKIDLVSAPAGVYLYTTMVVMTDGQEQFFSGSVTLLR